MAEGDETEVNESEGGDGEGAESSAGKKGFDAKKIILFVVLPLFILVGVGGGLFVTGTFDKLFGPKEEAHGEEAHEEDHGGGHGDSHAKKDSHGDGHGTSGHASGIVFLQLPNIMVNLSSPESQPRYLRLVVQLELASEEDKAKVEAVMPRVIDQFQTYLRELRVKDLRGSAGMYRLQMELLARVNAAAYPVEVKDVLFQEILIQ